MTDLTKLAERVEALTGPDREVDQAIHALVSLDRKHPYLAVPQIDDKHPSGRPYATPAYTESLDAALTLLPEGWDWSYNIVWGTAIIWCAGVEHKAVSSATPALALAAACLRAIGSKNDD